MNSHRQVERDRGNEVWIAQESIYRTSVNLNRFRFREVSSQVSSLKSFDRCSYREVSIAKQARWIKEVSRSYRGDRRFLDRSTQLSRGVEIVIKINCKSRQIGQVLRGVEEVSRLLKNSFSRREKLIYECNQACNTTKDPNIILNST